MMIRKESNAYLDWVFLPLVKDRIDQIKQDLAKLNPYSHSLAPMAEKILARHTRDIWPTLKTRDASRDDAMSIRCFFACSQGITFTPSLALLMRSLMVNGETELYELSRNLYRLLYQFSSSGTFSENSLLGYVAGIFPTEKPLQVALEEFTLRHRLASLWAQKERDLFKMLRVFWWYRSFNEEENRRSLEEWFHMCHNKGIVLKRIPVETLWAITPRFVVNRDLVKTLSEEGIAQRMFVEPRAVRLEKLSFLDQNRSRILKNICDVRSNFIARSIKSLQADMDKTFGPFFQCQFIRDETFAHIAFDEIVNSKYAFDRFKRLSHSWKQSDWDALSPSATRRLRNFIPGAITHCEYQDPKSLLTRIHENPEVRWHLDQRELRSLIEQASDHERRYFIHDLHVFELFDPENPIWREVEWKEMILKHVPMVTFRLYGISQINTKVKYIEFRRFCYRYAYRRDYLDTFRVFIQWSTLP